MKKKASRIIPLIVVALAVLIVVAIAIARQFTSTTADPHAGHDHSAGETHATTQTTAPLKIKDCFKLTENTDGTFGIDVKNMYGGKMISYDKLATKPKVVQIDEYSKSISGRNIKNDNLSAWTVFCNIGSMEVSTRFERVLAVVNKKVAYLEYRSDKWVVFVESPLDRDFELQGTVLPGLTNLNGENPKITYKSNKDGDLKITYDTADGEKTVTVKLGE